VCAIQRHFLFLIRAVIGSCFVISHRSSLDKISGHRRFKMQCKQRFMKTCFDSICNDW
jgi:hypothetical protein